VSLALWTVTPKGKDAPALAVLAATAFHARLRGGELIGLKAAQCAARREELAGPAKRRCGKVGVEVFWSARERRYHACATYGGHRQYVDVDPAMGDERDPGSARRIDDAARAAVMALVDADDVDEGLLLWERREDGEDRLMIDGGGR
jgi:hypothetical protein